MSDTTSAPGARLLSLWSRLQPFPRGGTLFSIILGRRIPYTGGMGARVEELKAGHARVRLPDRRKVRNHLDSIHAVALTNLGELSGGLATLTGVPPGIRGIVLRLESEYLKKARGILHAEATWIPPTAWVDGETPLHQDESTECWVEAIVRDSEGDEVARVRALWRLGRSH